MAARRSVTNNYLFTRTPWTVHLARGVVLTNTYDEFGEIIRKDYSDGTPPVDYSVRNSSGQPFSITDFDLVSQKQVVVFEAVPQKQLPI